MIQRNTPELFVRDVDEAVRFYTDVLGFQLEARMPEDASQPTEWAMVQQGGAAFMFEKPQQPRSPDGVAFYLAVEDAGALAGVLRGRGAAVEGPVDKHYGMREVLVTDPNGYRLIFSSAVPAVETAGASS
jgi:predicted enzyme related to lactoylglutathione lyase